MQAQDFFSALIESADVGIVAKDLDGVVLTWNPAAARLFGYSAEEMVGHSIRRLLPPGREDEEDEILRRIRAGEKIDQFFTRRLRKDGTELDVQVSISPVRDADGKIVGASKIVRDASALVEARSKLEDSERRFRQMADSISQLAWITDPTGEAIWFNRRFLEFSGLSENEILDEKRRDVIIHAENIAQVRAGYQQALARGEDWEDIFPMRRADGVHRWFLSRAMPLRNDAGEITQWFGTATDITDQREHSEQIRLLLHEVNHRSKNMLAMVQALARKTHCDDKSFIDRFERRVAGLSVNQDILVRREWREVPLEELARLQLNFLGQSEENLHIHGPEFPLSPRAAQAIGMAFHELATNSLKYGALSAEGGLVDIGWEHTEGERMRLWWRETGGPQVTEPERSGFGTMLIRDVPRSTLSADVRMEFHPDGLCWQIEAPATALSVQPAVSSV